MESSQRIGTAWTEAYVHQCYPHPRTSPLCRVLAIFSHLPQLECLSQASWILPDSALSSYQFQEVSAVFSVQAAAGDKSSNYFRLLTFHVTC